MATYRILENKAPYYLIEVPFVVNDETKVFEQNIIVDKQPEELEAAFQSYSEEYFLLYTKQIDPSPGIPEEVKQSDPIAENTTTDPAKSGNFITRLFS